MLDLKLIKNKVIAELDIRTFGMSDNKLYRFVLTITSSISTADSFMLSEGFTPGEIKEIKRLSLRASTLNLN